MLMNSAYDPLEKIKDILRDFLKDIKEIQSIHKNMSVPQMTLAFTVKDGWAIPGSSFLLNLLSPLTPCKKRVDTLRVQLNVKGV